MTATANGPQGIYRTEIYKEVMVWRLRHDIADPKVVETSYVQVLMNDYNTPKERTGISKIKKPGQT